MIYTISSHADKVAKIYHSKRLKDSERKEREEKLRYMVAHPPKDYVENFNGRPHYNLTWPLDILLDEYGQFCGFLMPKINEAYPILRLFTLKEREKIYEKTGIQFSFKFLLRAASNLSDVISNLHSAGYVIGDINEQNILFNKEAIVTILDVDSFQVTASNGQIWPCPVGKYEYTHPDLLKKLRGNGISYRDVRRLPAHDVFGMAVIIFRLLMGGFHPFQGVLPSEPLPLEEMIEKGIFVYARDIKSTHQVKPPPASPNYDHIYEDLGRLFHRTFVKGHEHICKTPSAKLFALALEYYERSLTRCAAHPNHDYYQRPDEKPFCPFCDYTKRFRIDPFPLHKPPHSVSALKPASVSLPTLIANGAILRIYMVFDLYMAPNPLLEEVNESLRSFFHLVCNQPKVQSQFHLSILSIGGKKMTWRELGPISRPIPPLLLNTDYQPEPLNSLYEIVRGAVSLSRKYLRSSQSFYIPWIVLYLSSREASLGLQTNHDEKISHISEVIQKGWVSMMTFALSNSGLREFLGREVVLIRSGRLSESLRWLFEAAIKRLEEPDPKKPIRLPSLGSWRS